MFLGLLLLGGDFVVILCGGERWLFFSLEFSGNFCFSLLYVVFALLVLVKLCSLFPLSLLLDLFFTCYGRLVVFRCGDGSVYCSCRFSVVVMARSIVLVVFSVVVMARSIVLVDFPLW